MFFLLFEQVAWLIFGSVTVCRQVNLLDCCQPNNSAFYSMWDAKMSIGIRAED